MNKYTILDRIVIWFRIQRWRRAEQAKYEAAQRTHMELDNEFARKRWQAYWRGKR